MPALKSCASLVLAAACTVSCGGVVPVPRSSLAGATEASPLGPSYVLIPLPSEDDALLGRVLPAPPEAGRSLEESARPNPCADKLEPVKESATAASFQDAQEMSFGGKVKAMLGAFGFQGDAGRATHFTYKIETSKRKARADTTGYVACCKEKGCGYGYVSALVYGEGEYATGDETQVSAGVDVTTIGSASGSTRLKILHKRKVRGWLAAVVTVTDPSKGEQLGPLGVAAAAGITESTIPQTVKVLYDKEKISVEGSGEQYRFRDGNGVLLTENEFVRRFRRVTGSNELDDVERRRNLPTVIGVGGAVALSLGVAVYGFANLTVTCSPSDYTRSGSNDCSKAGPTDAQGSPGASQFLRTAKTGSSAGLGLGILGSAAGAAFGTWLIVALVRGDGSADSHYLTEHDALLLTERHNRSLLRKTIKEVEKNHRQSRSETPFVGVVPIVGPGFVGVQGSF